MVPQFVFHLGLIVMLVLGAASKPDNRPVGKVLTLWSILAGAALPFDSSPVSLPFEGWPEADTAGGRGAAWTGYRTLSSVSISGYRWERRLRRERAAPVFPGKVGRAENSGGV